MKLTRDAFCDLRNEAQRALRRSKETPSVLICAGTGCIAGGAMKIYENLRAECESRNLPVYIGLKHDTDEEKSLHVKMSGCHGFCEMGPLVHIEPMGIMYIHVKPEDCHEILEKTVLGGEIIDRLVYRLNDVAYPRQEDIPFYKKQHRVVLENCGTSDAEDIEEYIAKGGYSGFERALFEMTDEQICRDIIDSGLRGRGGGGFPAGSKWDGARRQKADKKYIVCNGDEGDPGAFMDRSIMEGNPHSVLEGMMIAGLAAGSDEGYIYVRAEYPLAVSRLKAAIAKAQELGLLGDDILGSGFNFHLHVNRGAGAFVCGEGSALTSSIEGKRGMPRVKPPRTIEHGLWGKPTVLNNVETFANVPLIIRNGVDWYRHIGTEKSPGTKAFALTGNVVNTGLIEVPMGTTVREVIFDIGGGSTELVTIAHDGPGVIESLPIGSLTLAKEYVDKVFPKQSECEKIQARIRKELKKRKLHRLPAHTALCGVGGTARALLMLAQEQQELPDTQRLLTVSQLKKLEKALWKKDGKARELLLKTCPDRLHTIYPGMLILDELVQLSQCETIYISKYGVREGYLRRELARKKKTTEPEK